MFKNYIKIALRNIKRQKIYSLITMSGLILGLSVFIMFALLSDFTSNFDSCHKNADRIYAVVQVLSSSQEGEQHSAITPPPMVLAMISEFPEIEKASRFFPPGRMVVKYRNKIFYESGVRFVDADFLSIFTFKMIAGEKESVLSRANTVVMSEDSAFKYFGDEDPVGKTLTLDNKIDVVVTGITENPPNNSSIIYDFLVSMDTARSLYNWMDDWSTNNQAAFLLLSEGSDPTKLQEKFSLFIDKYYPDTRESPERFYLHSLLNFFLGSEGIDCYWGGGRISYVTIWIVAVLLLIIACINFMNISTARYITRAQEIGMRKVVGASRSQLIKQFLGESTLMALISMPAAILLYELLRPVFAANLGRIFDISIMDSPHVLILIFGVTILTGFFAGSYPAFYLSASKPVLVFQKRLVTGKKGSRFRKFLVVVQFTFSIILVLMTVISIKQSHHNLNVDLGYNRNNIIAVTMSDDIRDKLVIFKNELVRSKDIISVSASAALPIEWNSEIHILPEGVLEEDALLMNVYGVDFGLIEMLDIPIVQGRSFSHDYKDADNFIVTETAVRHLQWQDPIGKRITMRGQKGTVIGVVKDFHFKSILLEKMSPAVLYLGPDELNYMFVKYSTPESLPGVIEYIREKWNIVALDLPFEYVTLENAFYDVFQGDKTSEMTGILGALAIFLSCLGLFGLSSYSVERRVKEIGIRKVLGASVSRIVGMLTKDFIKLVAVANLIAIPIAYFMMNAIIHFVYTYPISIGVGIFVITAGLTLLIAFLTVSALTIKSALANPVDSLKYE
jgi:ABC-type antimicrobial peptide transport system permease subunit